MIVTTSVLLDALAKALLPRAPRDDYGSDSERVYQLLEDLRKECVDVTIDLPIPSA